MVQPNLLTVVLMVAVLVAGHLLAYVRLADSTAHGKDLGFPPHGI